jgi:hypothetical protein
VDLVGTVREEAQLLRNATGSWKLA